MGGTMAILNFNFTKINVEKNAKVSKQVNIKSGLNISSIAPSDVSAGNDQKAFTVEFVFTVNYEPAIGVIHLEGDLLMLASKEDAQKIEDEWAQKKSLPQEIGIPVFNRILHSCNVEALILSKEINLPAPIQLPKVKAGSVDSNE
jgi:hypothetical protein